MVPVNRPIPTGLRHDPGWAGAFVILESSMFERCSPVWQNVHLPERSIDWARIFRNGWSVRERQMLRAAASIHSRIEIDLSGLIFALDDKRYRLLTEALQAARSAANGKPHLNGDES